MLGVRNLVAHYGAGKSSLLEVITGLAPIVVQQIFRFIGAITRKQGTAVLLCERMASLALKIADYGQLLRRGQWVREGTVTYL